MVERFQGLTTTVYNLSVQPRLLIAWIVVLRFFDPWLCVGTVWDTVLGVSWVWLLWTVGYFSAEPNVAYGLECIYIL